MSYKLIFEELYAFFSTIGDVYRARAYRTAIDFPDKMGARLKEKRDEIEKTGTLKELKTIRNYAKIASIHGIGRTFIKKLINEKVYVSDPKELLSRSDLTDGQRLAIKYYKELSTRIPKEVIKEYLSYLKEKDIFNGLKFKGVGSYRRGAPSSGDIDILVKGKMEPGSTPFDPSSMAGYLGTLSKGKQKTTWIQQFKGRTTKSQRSWIFQVDALFVPTEEFPTALLYFTGSKMFNIYMRGHAKRQGFLLSEHGLFKIKGEENPVRIPIKNERDIFKKIGYSYVSPSQRSIL